MTQDATSSTIKEWNYLKNSQNPNEFMSGYAQ